MEILILRLKGPLISFGAPITDNYGFIQPYPAHSMVAGLIGNAIGLKRTQPDSLEALQQSFVYACREDKPGRKLRDYQTVDLGQPHLESTSASNTKAWRTDGNVNFRDGSNKTDTHIRYRDYWSDGIYTLAIAEKDNAAYRLQEMATAVKRPVRPLFIGRKCCLPSRPLFECIIQVPDASLDKALVEALRQCTIDSDAPVKREYAAWWPAIGKLPIESSRIQATDFRDFHADEHAGSRLISQGPITSPNE